MKYKSVIATTLLALLGVAACAQTTDAGFSVVVRHFVAPAYPVAAWLARVQGTVVTEVIIKPDGTPDSVEFVSAHPMFRQPVETALKQWSFQPISTATTLKITIRFQLDADCPLTGSQEPDKRYYVRTRVSADLPSNIEVTTCLPITTINTGKS
ncbi:MAG: energy transducer TonB [Acidobacteriia bacterium]|nr:energy transducer TonB [Terriglobia bacterium]